MAMELMSKEETARLDELEAVIKQDLKGFIRVGMALKEIRESRLYKGKYAAWPDYLKSEWDISKSYANYQIESSDVVMNLQENGHNCGHFETDKPQKNAIMEALFDDIPFPRNEAQARPLALLAPVQQVSAWEQVLRRTGGRVTAAAVTKVVQEILEGRLFEEKNLLKKDIAKEVSVPDDFSEQFTLLIEIMDLHRKAKWKGFNRKKAIEFVHAVEAYIKS